jgi:hypothetical protein
MPSLALSLWSRTVSVVTLGLAGSAPASPEVTAFLCLFGRFFFACSSSLLCRYCSNSLFMKFDTTSLGS